MLPFRKIWRRPRRSISCDCPQCRPPSRLARAWAWLHELPGPWASCLGFALGLIIALTTFAYYWQRANALLAAWPGP